MTQTEGDAQRSEPSVRLVVAEDEAVIRMDLVEQLLELSYEVVGQCGDGRTAIDLCSQLNPDVVLLDINMPILDGISAAREISSRTAVVMLTAYAQRELIDEAISAGAMAYLIKPWAPNDLVPAIEMARSRFAEMRTLTSQVDDLTETLRSRKLIDRAKGKLMAAYDMSEAEAFRWLQKGAMDRRTSMVAIAEIVLGDEAEADSAK